MLISFWATAVSPLWKTTAELIGIVAVVAYAIISYFQWQAQLDAMKIDERAWIGITDVSTYGASKTQDALIVKSLAVTVHNSGKTPALKMSFSCRIRVDRLSTDPIPDYDTESKAMEETYKVAEKRNLDRESEIIKEHPDMAEGIREARKRRQDDAEVATRKRTITQGGVMSPGATYTVPIATGQWHRLAQNGYTPLTIFLLGKITYSDVFAGTKPHTTKFCLLNTGEEEEPKFSFCPENNWMD
jgi:hypothetical protein